MNPIDRASELSFHTHFSYQDFVTDCKVFKVFEEVFKDKKFTYDFIVDYYFDLQKRAAKDEITMEQIQKRLYGMIVSNLDKKMAVSIPKVTVKHLGARKGFKMLQFFRKMGLK